MGEARDLHNQARAASEGGIVQLSVVRGQRAPPLSDDELHALRELLRNFRKISKECPMARRLLDETR